MELISKERAIRGLKDDLISKNKETKDFLNENTRLASKIFQLERENRQKEFTIIQGIYFMAN